MNLERLRWWKWSFWIRSVGQGFLLVAVWKFIHQMDRGGMSRSELLPWVGTGFGLYVVGRGLQIATGIRERRLALEARRRSE